MADLELREMQPKFEVELQVLEKEIQLAEYVGLESKYCKAKKHV